jgi:colanic acid biosynthesis glycosyl transferase WcaI
MFGILAAGKPIVAVTPDDADIATRGARHGFALCANPTDPDALAFAIRQLASDPTRLAAMGQAASTAAAQYSRAAEMQKLASIICAATSTPRH